MADQLNLANLAEMKFKDSIDVVYASSNIVLMLTNEPELKITKYVNDTKILENIENATEVEYNITITNTGHSAAYDIIVADDFVNRTTSRNHKSLMLNLLVWFTQTELLLILLHLKMTYLQKDI